MGLQFDGSVRSSFLKINVVLIDLNITLNTRASLWFGKRLICGYSFGTGADNLIWLSHRRGRLLWDRPPTRERAHPV